MGPRFVGSGKKKPWLSNEIPGLSDKQLRRIERGECRLTSNAAKKLAKAHGMTPNEYLQKLADALQE
jgi:hypothetical protein